MPYNPNITAGLQQISQGFGQFASMANYRLQYDQMLKDQAMKEQQLEMNKLHLQTAQQTVATSQLASLGNEYTQLSKGAAPDWFKTKEQDIAKIGQMLNKSTDQVKLEIKDERSRFEALKQQRLNTVNLYQNMFNRFGGDDAKNIGVDLSGFKSAIEKAKNQDELKLFTQDHEKLFQNIASFDLRQQTRQESETQKQLAREKASQDLMLKRADKFDDFVKEDAKLLKDLGQMESLLDKGKDYNQAYQMVRTQMVRRVGKESGALSEGDLQRTAPDPSYWGAVKRFWNQKAGGSPSPDDIKDTKTVLSLVRQPAQEAIQSEARNWATRDSKAIKGIDKGEFENLLLSRYGLTPPAEKETQPPPPPPGGQAPLTSKQVADQKAKAAEAIAEEEKLAAYNEAQRILADPKAIPEERNQATQVLDELKRLGFKQVK